MIWIGHERGDLIDWLTQVWVRATGRRIGLERDGSVPGEFAWLDTPCGETAGIGHNFFERYARKQRCTVRESADLGLMRSLDDLAGPTFDPARVAPGVRAFYERTAAFNLQAAGRWAPVFWPFGIALNVLFSRRLQQLNVPLCPGDTSKGMTSRVLRLEAAEGARGASAASLQWTGWLRTLPATGNVVFAGCYSVARIPGCTGPVVRVAFPLPNGAAICYLRPENLPDGGLQLIQAGRRLGEAGFYFVVRRGGAMHARYLRTMHETIRVMPDGETDARAEHALSIWGMTYLRIEYRMTRSLCSAVNPPLGTLTGSRA